MTGTAAIAENPAGSYRIMSASSGYTKALAIESALTSEGAKCIQYTYNASGNDMWVLEKVDSVITDGVYYIKNSKSELYMEVPNASTTNGTQVIQNTFTGGTNQKWQVTNVGNRTYVIRPIHSLSSALDVYGAYNSNDTKIDIWTNPDTTPSIRWHIVANQNGSYRILSQVSRYSKGLVVKGGATSAGAQCIQYTYSGTSNENWIFEKAS